MYAVVKSGGKEYRVSKGDILRVEKMGGEVGDKVAIKEVLLVSQEDQVRVGNPYLANAVVTGEIIQEIKGKKVQTFKMKKRKNYRRFKGHRQTYTYLKVNDISLS
jgi:large subunit ribosomal protein L21